MAKTKKQKIDIHDFYCMSCGKKVFACVRPQSHKREKFHRKKLYCPWCRVTANCVECATDQEVFEFKQDFENGLFEEEYKNSIVKCDNNE